MSERLHRVRWEDGAECAKKGIDAEMFFELENAADDNRVADPVVIAAALHLCEICPISERCFKEGVFSRAYGIWGGTTAEERGLRYRRYEDAQ